jgi:hypothetical protein
MAPWIFLAKSNAPVSRKINSSAITAGFFITVTGMAFAFPIIGRRRKG